MALRRALRCAMALLALGALGAAPASAADQLVQVTDNAFVSPGVAVTPGSTVTWNYAGGGDEHHFVHFEDEGLHYPSQALHVPWTTSRTFTTNSVYRYYCDEHGGPGGVGMAGIVYVNDSGLVPGTSPSTSFTTTADVVAVGQGVTFNAMTTDPDFGDSVIRHEWDLDGDGRFETDSGAQPTTSRTYLTSGQRTIRLRVTDKDMRTALATTRVLTVTNRPIAAFSFSPTPAQTGQTVTFNAAASSDPDGTIAKFEWDLDGDSVFETDAGTSPTTTRSYATPGTLTIALRVTDNLGFSTVTSDTLQVNAPSPPAPPPPPASPPAAVAPPAPPPPPAAAASCDTLRGAARTTCMQKACRTLKGAKRASCISKSCRYVSGAKRASCIQTSCRYVAKSRRASCGRASCRYLTGAKRKACQRRYARKPTSS